MVQIKGKTNWLALQWTQQLVMTGLFASVSDSYHNHQPDTVEVLNRPDEATEDYQ